MRNNPSGDWEVPSFRNSLERCWALEEPRPDRNLRGLKGTEKSTQIDEQPYQKDPTVSAGLRTDEEGGHSRFKDAGLDNGLKVFFQSACACLQLMYKAKLHEDYARVKKRTRNKSHSEKPPLSPLGVSIHRKTPKCTGESVCFLKCKYVLELLFFFLLNLFVWPEISLFNFLQALWTGYFFNCFFFLNFLSCFG